MSGEERLDGVFHSLVTQAQGIENFYDALFGFMRRKTDFFQKTEVSRNMVTGIMDKHIAIFCEEAARKEAIDKKKKEEALKKKIKEEAEKKAAADAKKPEMEAHDDCAEVTEEEAR